MQVGSPSEQWARRRIAVAQDGRRTCERMCIPIINPISCLVVACPAFVVKVTCLRDQRLQRAREQFAWLGAPLAPGR
eukprot:12462492-Alexandrium_andersonii.AAC.1